MKAILLAAILCLLPVSMQADSLPEWPPDDSLLLNWGVMDSAHYWIRVNNKLTDSGTYYPSPIISIDTTFTESIDSALFGDIWREQVLDEGAPDIFLDAADSYWLWVFWVLGIVLVLAMKYLFPRKNSQPNERRVT